MCEVSGVFVAFEEAAGPEAKVSTAKVHVSISGFVDHTVATAQFCCRTKISHRNHHHIHHHLTQMCMFASNKIL